MILDENEKKFLLFGNIKEDLFFNKTKALNFKAGIMSFLKVVNNVSKIEKHCKDFEKSYNTLSNDVEKINSNLESFSNRISNIEKQLQQITEPKEEWDRGFVVGEVEADKECE